jgi:hypothetical protein
MQVALKWIKSMMEVVGYKFPDLIDSMMKNVCDIAKASLNYQPEQNSLETNDKMMEKIRRGQRNETFGSAAACYLDLFRHFSKLQFTRSLIERSFEDIVSPMLFQQVPIGNTLLLLKQWSREPRFELIL